MLDKQENVLIGTNLYLNELVIDAIKKYYDDDEEIDVSGNEVLDSSGMKYQILVLMCTSLNKVELIIKDVQKLLHQA